MYLDPGTGTMIIQVIIASVTFVGVALVGFRAKIKRFFKRKKR